MNGNKQSNDAATPMTTTFKFTIALQKLICSTGEISRLLLLFSLLFSCFFFILLCLEKKTLSLCLCVCVNVPHQNQKDEKRRRRRWKNKKTRKIKKKAFWRRRRWRRGAINRQKGFPGHVTGMRPRARQRSRSFLLLLSSKADSGQSLRCAIQP